MKPRKSPKANFSKKANVKAGTRQSKDKLHVDDLRTSVEGGKHMLYSITPEGRIKLHRDLSKWRKVGSKAEYYDTAQSPKEVQQEKEIKALIARCTKELSLEQESAIAVKNMRKQEYLDGLAG